jgi:hypothetical protein
MKYHEQVKSHCYDNKPQKISKSVPGKKKNPPGGGKNFPPLPLPKIDLEKKKKTTPPP